MTQNLQKFNKIVQKNIKNRSKMQNFFTLECFIRKYNKLSIKKISALMTDIFCIL